MCFLKDDRIEGKIEGRRRTIKKKERKAALLDHFLLYQPKRLKKKKIEKKIRVLAKERDFGKNHGNWSSILNL